MHNIFTDVLKMHLFMMKACGLIYNAQLNGYSQILSKLSISFLTDNVTEAMTIGTEKLE